MIWRFAARWKPPGWSLLTRTVGAPASAYGTARGKNAKLGCSAALAIDGPSNYGDDLMRVKQVQNGRWVTVFPKEYAAKGATLQVQ